MGEVEKGKGIKERERESKNEKINTLLKSINRYGNDRKGNKKRIHEINC